MVCGEWQLFRFRCCPTEIVCGCAVNSFDIARIRSCRYSLSCIGLRVGLFSGCATGSYAVLLGKEIQRYVIPSHFAWHSRFGGAFLSTDLRVNACKLAGD